jgi:hypothetical protein
MPKVVSDLILTEAELYYAPVGTALPADTVAAGGDWGNTWISVGFTTAPFKLVYDYETKEPNVQQALGPLKRYKIGESAGIETMIGELSLSLLPLAWTGSVTATAAGSGQPGKETYEVGGSKFLQEYTWAAEGTYVDEDGATFPIRVQIYKATAESGGELEFDKEEYTGTALKLAALEDTSKAKGKRLIQIVKILEPATV